MLMKYCSSRSCMAVLTLISAVLLSSILHCVAGIPIDGPHPMNALAPLGTKMTFTCIVNITELTVERFILKCLILHNWCIPELIVRIQCITVSHVHSACLYTAHIAASNLHSALTLQL